MSNSPVIAFLNKMTDLILLNILFLVSCIPVVTIGAAVTAMYYVCIVSIRQGDGYVLRRYITSFQQNFKQATILWLMVLLIAAVVILDLMFWSRIGNLMGTVMICLSIAVAMIIYLVVLYVFPVLAKLEGSLLTTIKNAAALSIGYLPYTLILLVLTGVFVWGNLTSVGMNAISLFIGFALLAYIKSFFIYKVMMEHIDERFDDFYADSEER